MCRRRFRCCAVQFDEEMAARAQEAEAAGQKLVYTGLVEVASGKCAVCLKVCPQRTAVDAIILWSLESPAEKSSNKVVVLDPLHMVFAHVLVAFCCRHTPRSIPSRS